MEIETARLLLREFEPADWAAVQAYQSDERYWRFYERPSEAAPEAGAAAGPSLDRRNLVDSFIAWKREEPRRYFQLAITLKAAAENAGGAAPGDAGRLIGNCGLRRRRLFDFGRPELPLEADIGYELDPVYWGQGYASEAVTGLVERGFEAMALHRLWAYCLDANTPSWRLLERVGFRLEGHVRENERMQDGWWDSRLYGMLAAEWRKRRQPGEGAPG